jgi:exoribonuclease-2
MSLPGGGQRALLLQVARRAMVERGLAPDFSPEALAEATHLKAPAPPFGADVRDLRDLAWCSIDNDDSRDLDQLTVVVGLPDDGARVLIAVADVSASVGPGSAVDAHANANTTSVYTPPQIFPMLPERLSTDLTSLGQGVDRLSIVIEVVINAAGSRGASDVYRAAVRNQAKLAYSSVGAWLEGKGTMPAGIGSVPGLAENLRLQDRVAQRLRAARYEHGALELETPEVRARIEGDAVVDLTREGPNRAKDIIEDFMIAANGVIAGFLAQRRFPIMRRVVRSPERWQRIVDIAQHLGEPLPPEPDPKTLQEFLVRRRAADPLRFPDLSLAVIKLLGRGEYAASFPGQEVSGHFGLAVSDYTHSTAPNRRYPDLVTQRLVRAAVAGQEVPYDRPQLEALAAHCTQKEDDAQRIERLVRKAAAACLMSDRIGSEFDGIVTGASAKGTWARVFDPPVEGRIERGQEGLDVGDQVRVRLLRADPERGFIDFARVAHVPVGASRGHPC